MRGKAEYVKRGILPIGTGRGLYGYRWDTNVKKRVPLPFEIEVVKKVFAMMADGKSTFHVAKTLNEQGIPTKAGGNWHLYHWTHDFRTPPT